jgi:two-component system chemotaxis response regulator CheB
MEKNDLSNITRCVLIGGSAGSLKVLMRMLPALSVDISFPIVIIIHRKNDRKSSLEQLLNEQTYLRVKEAEDKEMMTNGTIYLAPPDYHLLVEKDCSLSLDGSEKIQWSRPSIDVTFQSAAETFGNGTLGILLSGANNDGTYGLECIQKAGGRIMIQRPANADIPAMPSFALQNLKPDHLLDDIEMAAIINQF